MPLVHEDIITFDQLSRIHAEEGWSDSARETNGHELVSDWTVQLIGTEDGNRRQTRWPDAS